MTIGEFIHKRRIELGLTLEDIGNAIGVSKSTVKKWETGYISNMRRDRINILAKTLKVSPIVFINNNYENPEIESLQTTSTLFTGMENNKAKNDIDTDLFPYTPTHKIPVLGRISAGLPLYAEEHIEGYTYTDLNGGNEYFALRVKGDSMTAARIYENDILIVRKQPTVDDGEIAIVLVDDNEATVKEFYQTGSTVTLVPRSHNSEHKIQVYDLTKTNIKILGKVVRVQYDL